MDTSKEYIDMCQKALEIQEIYREKQSGINKIDFEIFTNALGGFSIISDTTYNPSGKVFPNVTDFIWLPRQDQLQDMLSNMAHSELIQRFWTWFKEWEMKCTAIDYAIGDSLDKLWLMFVMKEKYNKVWNSNDWVAE